MVKRKNRNSWQDEMYDEAFATSTIASPYFEHLAKEEVGFLIPAMALKPGDNVFDAPCGTGRHARLFSKRGMKVTALDLSKDCIRMAERENPGKKIAYRRGNLADLKAYRGKFDAVVNLFTSFGYFSTEAENERVLRGLVAALKPGGRIAFHLIDRDWLMKRFQHSDWSEKNGIMTFEARKYDPKTKRIESQLVLLNRKTGRGSSYYHSTRLYSKPEMVRLMKAAGLGRVQVYGDTDGSVFRKGESSHPIYIGWKLK